MIPRIALAAAMLLATHPVAVFADCHQAVRVQKQVHHVQQQVVHHQAYVAPAAVVNYGHHAYAAQLQQAPLYYSVGAQIHEEAVTERIARKVQQLVEQRLDAALSAIQQPSSGFEHPGAKLAAQKCATCHVKGSKATTREENPATVLFAGTGDFVGTPAQAAAAIDASQSGRMPPPSAGKELSIPDGAVLKEYLEKFAPAEQ